jgi:hypothetical protein
VDVEVHFGLLCRDQVNGCGHLRVPRAVCVSYGPTALGTTYFRELLRVDSKLYESS